MSTRKVRIIRRVGDPRDGVIIQPGTVTDLPEAWARQYVAQGMAEYVEAEPAKPTAGTRKKK